MFYVIIYLCISNVPNPKCLVYSRPQKSMPQINEWMDKWIDWINEVFLCTQCLPWGNFICAFVSGVPSAWNILLHLFLAIIYSVVRSAQRVCLQKGLPGITWGGRRNHGRALKWLGGTERITDFFISVLFLAVWVTLGNPIHFKNWNIVVLQHCVSYRYTA